MFGCVGFSKNCFWPSRYSGTPNGGGGTQPKKDLSINPGKEFLVCTDANKDGVYLYDFVNTPTQISSTSIISKPSVTDDGSEIYFVAKTNKLHMLTFNKSTGKYVESILDNTAVYRNAIISKDGTLLAALLTKEENIIHVYDFLSDEWKDFTLYNPTSTSSTTSDVRYADFMDFDHSVKILYMMHLMSLKEQMEMIMNIGILDQSMFLICH